MIMLLLVYPNSVLSESELAGSARSSSKIGGNLPNDQEQASEFTPSKRAAEREKKENKNRNTNEQQKDSSGDGDNDKEDSDERGISMVSVTAILTGEGWVNLG